MTSAPFLPFPSICKKNPESWRVLPIADVLQVVLTSRKKNSHTNQDWYGWTGVTQYRLKKIQKIHEEKGKFSARQFETIRWLAFNGFWGVPPRPQRSSNPASYAIPRRRRLLCRRQEPKGELAHDITNIQDCSF